MALGTDLHAPLKKDTSLKMAISMVNVFYGKNLKVENFQDSQVFIGGDPKRYTLELIDLHSGIVSLTLINMTETPDVVGTNQLGEEVDFSNGLVLPNPLVSTLGVQWLTAPVIIDHVEELAFLDNMAVGETLEVMTGSNEIPYQLAQLLNTYNVLGSWSSGSLGTYCTGGFKLVHWGDSAELSHNYLVEQTEHVAIIEILQGKHKGLLCLRI